jgi:tetratricopeptide (TPR) repeat protein
MMRLLTDGVRRSAPRERVFRTLALCLLLAPSVLARAEPPAPSKPAAKSAQLAPARECFRAAQVAYVAGDLAGALEGFQCAYRSAPSAELHWNLARVYERMGEPEQGIQHYRAFLESAQVTPRERKRVEARIAALADLRSRRLASQVAPKPTPDALSAEARTFYERGVKLFAAGQYQGALAAFSAALRMSGAPELHFNLAVTSERLGRRRDARDHYRAYLGAQSAAVDRTDIEARIGVLSEGPRDREARSDAISANPSAP